MLEKELEFRGIKLEHLDTYLIEIGGKKVSDTSPYVFYGDGWSARIISKNEILFTAAFKVETVTIRFSAQTEELLAEVIQQFRKKTFRAGG